jgi:predicted ATPase
VTTDCECRLLVHNPRRIALTGGPGAGKTAVLDVIRRSFCRHVLVLPEAASILFQGGFPRHDTAAGRAGAQRAIFRVQDEMERIALEEQESAVILCDRGTVDGLAYWPAPRDTLWGSVGTNHHAELSRYVAVIHLRTPAGTQGYDHSNPVRRESAQEAALLDARVLDAWSEHPRRSIIAAEETFAQKVQATLEAVRAELPRCCRSHAPDRISSRDCT